MKIDDSIKGDSGSVIVDNEGRIMGPVSTGDSDRKIVGVAKWNNALGVIHDYIRLLG